MKEKKHWMKKAGLTIGVIGALLDVFVPGPWLTVGGILGGYVTALGATRNVEEAFDKKVRK